MATVTPSTVMTPMGLVNSWYYPITNEPAAAKPVYGSKLDMGHAVKAYLSITVASGSVVGDNVTLVEVEEFVSGQLDAETTASDLQKNAVIYGHTYAEATGEVSSAEDHAPNGGYAYIQHILMKDKSKIYRATCLHKVNAMTGSETQNADTRQPGTPNFAKNAVSYRVLPDNTGAWRTRQDFDTQAAAVAFIEAFFAPSAS